MIMHYTNFHCLLFTPRTHTYPPSGTASQHRSPTRYLQDGSTGNYSFCFTDRQRTY